MASTNLVQTPNTTTVIDQRFFLRPLGGPQHPQAYLDRFPEEVYNKTIDARLVKFLYALLGPSGVGWLRKNYLQARILLEEFGIETFDLNAFYGDPLRFGRIVEEVYDDDLDGLIPHDAWQRIKARDARYRNRAIDFIGGARLGNTPEGMHLVARSGLGHEVEIIENYRALWDEHSDDRLFLPYYGKTRSTEEFVVLPRRELSRSEVQTISTTGSPIGGSFRLFFPMGDEANNTTTDIPYNVDRFTLQLLLEGLSSIGPGNVVVEGGPLPDTPIQVTFIGDLAARDVPELVPTSSLTGGSIPLVLVSVTRSGVDAADEVVNIAPRDQRYLQEALDRIRPWASIPTMGESAGLQQRQIWQSSHASSSYSTVIRYVTGKNGVLWPKRDNRYWIETNVEHEGQRPFDDRSQHYRGFHTIAGIEASSTHMGAFFPHQWRLYPFLKTVPRPDYIFNADLAKAAQPEPLTVSYNDPDQSLQLINEIYPIEYRSLPGVTKTPVTTTFWASAERDDPLIETLTLDLGSAKAVNYVYFEMSRKPIDMMVEYDLVSAETPAAWREVTLDPLVPSVTTSSFDFETQNPWTLMEINCVNRKGEMIYTRWLRLSFVRRDDFGSPFRLPDGTILSWSIEVRNLRVGRRIF